MLCSRESALTSGLSRVACRIEQSRRGGGLAIFLPGEYAGLPVPHWRVMARRDLHPTGMRPGQGMPLLTWQREASFACVPESPALRGAGSWTHLVGPTLKSCLFAGDRGTTPRRCFRLFSRRPGTGLLPMCPSAA